MQAVVCILCVAVIDWVLVHTFELLEQLVDVLGPDLGLGISNT